MRQRNEIVQGLSFSRRPFDGGDILNYAVADFLLPTVLTEANTLDDPSKSAEYKS